MLKNVEEFMRVEIQTPVKTYIGATGCSISFDLPYKANDSYAKMRRILNSKLAAIAEKKPERMKFEKLTEFRISYQENECTRKIIDNDRDLFEAICCHGIYQAYKTSQLITKIEFAFVSDELNLAALIETSLFGATPQNSNQYSWYFQPIHRLLPDPRDNKPNWELRKTFEKLEAEKNKQTMEAAARETGASTSDEVNETYV